MAKSKHGANSSTPSSATTTPSSSSFVATKLPHLIVVIISLVMAVWFAASKSTTVVSVSEFSSLRWGTYRPNVYLGVRGSWPDSPLFGWMWGSASPPASQQILELRHDAQESDHLKKYGWMEHNGQDYGKHEIIDEKVGVNITNVFIASNETNHKQKWNMRVYVENLQKNKPSKVNLFWYISLASNAHVVEEIEALPTTLGQRSPFSFTGSFGSHALNNRLTVSLVDGHEVAVYASAIKTPAEAEGSWKAKDLTQYLLKQQYFHEMQQRKDQNPTATQQGIQQQVEEKFTPTLPKHVEADADFIVLQLQGKAPFTLDFSLIDSTTTASENQQDEDSSSFDVNQEMSIRSQMFQDAFLNKFALTHQNYSTAQHKFARAIFSNLVGGIGYFYGPQLVEEKKVEKGKEKIISVETEASSLLTCVPSRSFFPRGFMWDEGFHQLLVSSFSLPLSLSVLSSWFNQIKDNGWLPREQILGAEARARVPEQFRAQKPDVANPPTMILALQKMLERLRNKEEKAAAQDKEEVARDLQAMTQFIVRWFPTLHRHVMWFFQTQASVDDTKTSSFSTNSVSSFTDSQHLPLSFRWAGRTKDHCLASGLDDYPRAKWLPNALRDKNTARHTLKPIVMKVQQDEEPVKHGLEGHVDLHAWMIVLARTMGRLASFVDKHEQKSSPTSSASLDYAQLSSIYASYASRLESSLEALHWDARSNSFADYAYRNGTKLFIQHRGYVQFFPLFLGVLPPSSPQVVKLMEALRSEANGVWSPWGLRSLSTKDRYFGSKEDYWRGHIWINMNYLALQGMKGYELHDESPEETRNLAKRIGEELRHNVINNVFKEYQRTGYVWEQYHAVDGKGRKSHPFTGWTALTLLMMAGEY